MCFANERYFYIHLKPNFNAESYFVLRKYIAILHPTEGEAVPQRVSIHNMIVKMSDLSDVSGNTKQLERVTYNFKHNTLAFASSYHHIGSHQTVIVCCDAVWTGGCLPTLRINSLLLSSWPTIKVIFLSFLK
jgi:hypothetical protein